MNTPKIRFKGYTDAWEQRKFSETFDGLQNNTLSRAEMNYEKGEVKNIHYGDILVKFGAYIDVSKEELPYICNPEIAERYSSSFLNDGDIIIADTAEDSTVGKCSEIVGSVGLKLLSGLHTIPCRPKQKHAAKFLGYYMNSPSYHQQLIPLMQGIKVTSISKSALNNTDMIVPKSLEEQGLIGEYFSNIDNLITLHQRKCDRLNAVKKYMLQKMFPQNGAKVPEIRFKGFTDDWEQRKLSEVAYFIRGSFPQPYTNPDFYDESEGKPFVQVGDIGMDLQLNDDTKAHISSIAEGKSRFVKAGTVIVALQGSIEKSIGRTAITQYDAFVDRTILIFESYKIPMDKLFFAQTIKSLFEIQKEKAWGATISTITKEHLSDFVINVPTLDEQKKLGAFFRNIDSLITLHQRKADSLKELKKFMLQNMFP